MRHSVHIATNQALVVYQAVSQEFSYASFYLVRAIL